MIRPFTCVCLLLAAGSGLYTYQAKHQAELLDRQIQATLKLADAARQRASVLRAEYALLNDPTRLAELTAQHMPALRPTAPGQFTNLAELDRRLPPVGPPPMPPGPVAEPPPVETSVLTASATPTPKPAPPQAPTQAPEPSPALAQAATQPKAVAAKVAPPPQIIAAVAGSRSPRATVAVATNAGDVGVTSASLATPVASAPLPAAAPKSAAAKPHAKAARTAPATHPPRADPFVTPVSSPEAVARLAPAAAPTRTFSALGMAHSAMPAPAASFNPGSAH